MTDTPILSSPIAPDQTPSSPSVWSRMANVIAAPGEAFDGIVGLEKKTSLWLTPMILSIVLMMGFSAVMMNNPAMKQRMRQEMAKRFDDQIREGKITQEQADKFMEVGEGIGKYAGIFGSVIAVPLFWMLIAAGFYVILAFMLGGEVTFGNILIVVALAGVVGMIETIVGGFMQYATADIMAQPNLGYVLSNVDNGVVKAALMRVNPFSFWWLYVIITGFSKITAVPKGKITIGVVSAWLLISVIFVAWAGLFGGNAMMGK